MSAENAAALVDLWLEDLPRSILQTVCRSPGASEGAVIGSVTSRLPSSINDERTRDRCLSSVRWFVHHGDIASCGNRRYAALPPYGVVEIDRGDSAVVRIFGNPLRDGEIIALARGLDGEFISTFVRWYWQEGYSDADNVGWERMARVPLANTSSLISSLATLGMRVVEPGTIRVSLPSIHDIVVPPMSFFGANLPSWGLWQEYDPTISSLDRWKDTKRVPMPQSQAVFRWFAGANDTDYRIARYFLCVPASGVAETGRSSVRLWMHYLDHRVGNPRTMSIKVGEALVPGELPDPHRHWLEISSSQWHRVGSTDRYKLETDSAAVARVMQETLGLIVK